ncbi:MAG: phosphoglucomutase/phosphomannomutase family protein [Bacteroidetes bacterium]|nr:phosphoglucomutase/phosphomannomutase family protein [Bacteroidota bacterium]MCB9226482.1 phosphoglucomutase/phosphomannomutase family protein [Chitinophagales bacterium]
MLKIKFGTDGWRAIIADTYTVENVCRVAQATAEWLKSKSQKPSLVLGYDCRFGGYMFAEAVIDIMAKNNVKVHFDKNFVSTPMISLATHKLNATAGVILTASHNPPSYNGYKLKSTFGGPTIPKEIQEVEDKIPNNVVTREEFCFTELEKNGMLEIHNFEDMYYNHVVANFEMDVIRNSKFTLAYDAMYGAGQRILPRLLPNAKTLHCDYNPSFKGQAPEPIHKNLLEFSALIANDNTLDIGLANDGDADRIGLYNKEGHFIDAHHIILLLIHILHKYKKMTGKVVIAFSVSPKIKKMCKAYGIDVQVTPIGFKHIAEIMVKEDVLVGGEESGGIAVKGHIPERDGIWDGLVILEHMAKSGKSLEELINEVYEVVGEFSYNRNDLHLAEEKKQEIIQNCKNKKYTAFGKFNIEEVEDIDGFKYHLGNDRNVMIRPSGTEPVLRVYAEAETPEMVEEILSETKKVLLS